MRVSICQDFLAMTKVERRELYAACFKIIGATLDLFKPCGVHSFAFDNYLFAGFYRIFKHCGDGRGTLTERFTRSVGKALGTYFGNSCRQNDTC